MNPKKLLKSLLIGCGYEVSRVGVEKHPFHSWHYLRHNARRLEHLASLGLPVFGRTVLEVGAGIGDHSHYYLDRGCRITITEARPESVAYIKARYPQSPVRQLDLDAPDPGFQEKFEVIHCYGVLYHLKHPADAVRYLADRNTSLLLLETCVSFGSGLKENFVSEIQEDPTQATTGIGCRPTREWVFAELQKHYPHVYSTTTQPNHDEFPIDWRHPDLHQGPFSRAVFVASRERLDYPCLVDHLLDQQKRHP